MEQNLSVPRRTRHPDMLLQAYHDLGNLHTYAGELGSARQSLDEVITRYDSKTQHPSYPVL